VDDGGPSMAFCAGAGPRRDRPSIILPVTPLDNHRVVGYMDARDYTRPEQHLVVYDELDGSVRPLVENVARAGQEIIWRARVSLDKRYLAIVAGGGDHDPVKIYDISGSGRAVHVDTIRTRSYEFAWSPTGELVLAERGRNGHVQLRMFRPRVEEQ